LKYKAAIIGAGIVGSALARELTRYEEVDVLIIEKEPDFGWGTTKANTGIVHAGYDDEAEKYPWRAKLCRTGNELWHELGRELQVPIEWCGALVLAFDEHDRRVLRGLQSRGRANGVPALELIESDFCSDLEPNISKDAIEGLWAPTSGIISPYEAAIALAENAVDNGARLCLETFVKQIVIRGGEVVGVDTDRGFQRADIVINAAGIFGDQVSRTAGISDLSIRPRRGEYFLFDRDATPKVHMTLFHTPRPATKGVVVTPTTEGNLLVGPNAKDVGVDERDATMTTRDGLDEVWKGASRLVAALPPRNTAMRTFAGLRPEPSSGDFIIEVYDRPEGLVNCVGMRSPGLTSAPAIAKEVIGLLKGRGLKLTMRQDWKASREAIRRFRLVPSQEKDGLISSDASYGKIVCACEMVTEAEIKEAIRRGARTFDSIKFRTRAGMGRCQGSFCLAKTLALLGRETREPIEALTQRGKGSNFVRGPMR